MRKTGTKVWARTFLPAVRELVRWYETLKRDTRGFKANYDYANCPLCGTAQLFIGKADLSYMKVFAECKACPWAIYSRRDFQWVNAPCVELDYQRKTVKDRLARLRRWERKLLKIINTKKSVDQGEW